MVSHIFLSLLDTILFSLKDVDYIWLGAYDNDHNKVYHWVNGRPCCPNFWTSGQPDNGGGNQRCLGLWWQKDHGVIGFDDGSCGAKKAFVCQSGWKFCNYNFII